MDSRTSPGQVEVLDSALLHSGFSCVLQMPTGSGKTWLAEQAIAGVLQSGGRAIYLTPLRALAAELASRWRTRFGSHCVGIFTGDYGVPGAPFPVPFGDARLLVMTPERLDACTRAWRAHWSWIPEVDLVVVDEFHLLADKHRGARLEGTLSRIRRLNPFMRLLCLSATLGNREELADWLGALDYVSTWRPVPLQWRTVRYRKATEKPHLLLQEVTQTTRTGGKSLVFVHSRRRAEELQRQLMGEGLRAQHHHAGLGHEERQVVERDFREGATDVVVATSTLEMGLNLPVRQVVLYDLQVFDGSEFSPLPTSTVWQRGGRAGRPGLDDRGEVILLAPVWDRDVDRYARGDFEPIQSGLTSRVSLAEQIVAEIGSGMCTTPWHLQTVFGQSLAAHQKSLPYIGSIVAEMCNAGMLREDLAGDTVRLRATRLGRVAVRHLLAPATIVLFNRILERGPSLTFLDLLLLCASSEDCQPVLPVDFEELDELTEQISREPSSLLSASHRDIVTGLGIDGKRLLSAVKMALVARAWTRTSDGEYVAEQYGCYPFEITRLCESLERLLLAMSAVCERPDEISSVDDVPDGPEILRARIRTLQTMVRSTSKCRGRSCASWLSRPRFGVG